MKRVISIHLNGKIFHIEEDACVCLSNALEKQWQRDELEKRIAERLESKLNNNKNVVTYLDVLDVLHQLNIANPEARDSVRRLYRNIKDKMLGGVCSGLGEYFEIDPVIFRVLFVLGIFFATMGIWLYVILWIIIPSKQIYSK